MQIREFLTFSNPTAYYGKEQGRAFQAPEASKKKIIADVEEKINLVCPCN